MVKRIRPRMNADKTGSERDREKQPQSKGRWIPHERTAGTAGRPYYLFRSVFDCAYSRLICLCIYDLRFTIYFYGIARIDPGGGTASNVQQVGETILLENAGGGT